jgi:hypothetical protein
MENGVQATWRSGSLHRAVPVPKQGGSGTRRQDAAGLLAGWRSVAIFASWIDKRPAFHAKKPG